MDAVSRSVVGEIREKLALLRRVADEPGAGVVVEAPTGPVEAIPGLPEEVADVFGVVGRLEGTYFRFVRPDEVLGPAAWAARERVDDCPMGDPLTVGRELVSTARVPEMSVYGERVVMDTDDGVVYFLASDDYMWLCRTPDADVEFPELAPGIAAFFNDMVLGPGYVRLVDTVLGPGARVRRDRKGRYADTWLRLLIRAGLLSAEDAERARDDATPA
ncbi:hypothetical protein LO772_14675 [Yinghuangia sp. ASG 101]|uniref:hypothetical protein n=1 Tax=Yinghuangia sp. ASG 101 TaxID=2896848 RepID=UPI001E43BD9B|nr:hypothetical protein [Yinghuangia sp. ASG 101]UGQ14710.1 hypothetical protein LO772_14675 [Yinghuangia sp. ASG 101]